MEIKENVEVKSEIDLFDSVNRDWLKKGDLFRIIYPILSNPQYTSNVNTLLSVERKFFKRQKDPATGEESERFCSEEDANFLTINMTFLDIEGRFVECYFSRDDFIEGLPAAYIYKIVK